MRPEETDRLESVSVLLPVTNETFSLIETVQIILQNNEADIKEIIILVCSKTTPESLSICKQLQERTKTRIYIHQQKRPFLGGALRDGLDIATGSHVIIMSSDFETNPNAVKNLIAEAKKSPSSIISASRWIKGGGFEKGYPLPKLFFNYIFQKAISVLYGTRVSDMSHGYRLYPNRLVQAISWEELRHCFLLETLVKPLRLGVNVIEIPEIWRPRIEGRPQSSLIHTLDYVRVGLQIRFRPIERFLKN